MNLKRLPRARRMEVSAAPRRLDPRDPAVWAWLAVALFALFAILPSPGTAGSAAAPHAAQQAPHVNQDAKPAARQAK